MLTKHKIWLGAGVVAAAVGGLSGRSWDLLHPRGLAAADGRAPSTAGGEAGEASPEQESGERGENAAVVATAERRTSAADSESGEHGSAGQTDAASVGSFDDVLKYIFMGEGGQDGRGISPLRKAGGSWTITIPALSGGQLKQALSGNSLRSENHFALHFAPPGQFQGWALTWARAPLPTCSGSKDPNRAILDGECWIGTEHKLAGAWAVKGDALCLTPSPAAVTSGNECTRAAIVLNSVLLFGPDGKMVRKGSDLRKGQELARTRTS